MQISWLKKLYLTLEGLIIMEEMLARKLETP